MILAYIQTFVVYLGLAYILITCSNKYVKTNSASYLYGGLLIYALVMGSRYFVGADYISYSTMYQDQLNYGEQKFSDRWELGFLLLMKSVAFFNAPTSIFLGCIAFIQLYFISGVFKDKKEVLPFLFFVFMIGSYWLTYSNALRHMLAVPIWIYSIKYISTKQWIHHYLLILLAFMFHKSALILLPVYPLYNFYVKEKCLFGNIKVQLLLFVCSLIVMNTSFLQDNFAKLDNLVLFFGYDFYFEGMDVKELIGGQSIGLGFLINKALTILLICNSNKCKQYFNSRWFNILYDMYFVGILLSHIFIDSIAFSRVNYYFNNMSLVVGALFMYYFYNSDKRNYRLMQLVYILTFLAVMYRAMDNSALFIFDWQDNLFYLKSTLKLL